MANFKIKKLLSGETIVKLFFLKRLKFCDTILPAVIQRLP